MRALGAALLATWAIHVGYHAWVKQDTYDFLWTCNMACALLAAGCLFASRHAVAIGTTWLAFGLPVWIIGILSGNELLPTAVIIHVGGVACGILVLKKLGFPRGTWWRATLWLLIVLAVSRAVTPPKDNVNLVFSVYRGWEAYFPTWRSYFAFTFTSALVTFVAVEACAMKLKGGSVPSVEKTA